MSNSKHHYNPTHFKIFIGNKRKLRMMVGEGKRKPCVRREKGFSTNSKVIHDFEEVNTIRRALISVEDLNLIETSYR